MGAQFSDLLGKILTSVEQRYNDEMVFTTTKGEQFRLYHFQDCCESVQIEDICGDLADLVGAVIVQAEEAELAQENPPGVPIPEWQESFTWTFYKLATAKGHVTIRWYGDSNGYYSEQVDFERVETEKPHQ